jgi:hypothetical protein
MAGSVSSEAIQTATAGTVWIASRAVDAGVRFRFKSMHHRIPAARCVRVLLVSLSSLRAEGAGKTGCSLHPWSAVPKAPRKMHSGKNHRFSRNNPAFPAQWFDGLCRTLLGEPSSVATVALRIADAAVPGWAGRSTTRLGASFGRQDHTILPYAISVDRVARCRSLTSLTPALRLPSAPTPLASTAPRTPRIVTTRTPLSVRRDGGRRTSISENRNQIIFRERSGRPKSA